MEELQKFWAVVAEVWREGVLGVDIGRMLVAAGIVLLFLLFRNLFTRFVLGLVKRWSRRTRTEFDDKVIDSIEPPVRFVPLLMGLFIAIEYLSLDGAAESIAGKLIRSLVAFTIFWAFYRAVEPMSFALRRLERIFTRPMVDWLVKAIKLVFVFMGAATILQVWGIAIGPIIAGFGLFGVAVALGAQDMFKNLIAGLLIIAEKRFNIGDWINVDGVVEGTVENIGFRSTRVRRFDKAPVHVPNSRLADNAVTNFSAMTHRRIYWKIGVEYRTTVDQLRAVRDGIESYIMESEEFAQPPDVATFVRIDSFNDSSIDIMVYCFTRTTVWGEWLEIKERLACRIKEIVEGAGTSFAFPSRSIYVETPGTETPEVFVPPEDAAPPATAVLAARGVGKGE